MRWLPLWTIPVLLAVVVGCDRTPSRQPASAPSKLLLYCGAGIQPPVAELAAAFSNETGIGIDIDYAGSEVLLSRIKLHPRGDLYMPGDRYYVELAEKAGLTLSSRPVCYFVPTILVRKDNPKSVGRLEDLLRPDVRLGLGNEEACAIGRQSRLIFEKNRIPWADVNTRLTFKSQTVNELGIQIQTGSLDAVIVWDAVAAQYAAHGQQVPIPPGRNVISTVEVAVLKSTQQESQAGRFVDFVLSDRGKAIFIKHHYRVEPPGSQAR